MDLDASGRPVILVVEDDFLLRIHATDIVRAAGFEPLEAATADEAIAILESRNDVAVVFTDIQMPGSMDGLRLARAVRGRWLPIKIVTTSGQRAVKQSDLPEGGHFLPKPYSAIEISGLLRELTR
jgi:CheY-like chemotaxis protein